MEETSTVELLYIWINQDETGFIREQGFNLSPEFHFEIVPRGDGSFVMTCTKNTAYPNVWKTGNIVNLTAIVGENGSGKSTLLRHLAFSTLRPINSKEKFNPPGLWMIHIYRIKGSVQIYHNLPEHLIENRTGYPITSINVQNKSENAAENPDIPDSMNLQTKFYMSNAFSSSSSSWNSKKYPKPIFFSTTGNMERSKAFFQQISSLNTRGAFNYLQQHVIDTRKYKDFEQFCALSYYHRLKSADIQTVLLSACNREIRIGVTSPTQWFFRNKDFASLKAIESPFLSIADVYFHSTRSLDLYSVLLDNLILEIAYLIADEVKDQDTYEQIRNAPLEHLAQCKADPKVLHYYETALQEIRQFGDILCHALTPSTKVLNDIRSVARNAVFPPHSYGHDCLCKYIDDLMQKDTSFVLKYLIIDMPPLSSGEQALQNLFTWLKLAPFYHKILNDDTLPIQDNILLLLDEVDLYMHPEWQRKFLKYLSDELEQQYPGKHIQVIISTHSPLVLSDIPAGNIIYLQKGDEPYCTLSHGPARKESFGANIFSLLKDSFFLEHSMGAFALEKITGMIQKLNELKQNPTDNTLRTECRELRPLIDIIGEPAVRRKLLMMYDDLFHTAPHEQDIDFLRQLLLGDSQYRSALENIIAEAKSHQEGNET